MDTPLKRARLHDKRKPSQSEVAKATGIDQSFYSRLENGDTNASAETAMKLAAYFDTEINTLFTPAMYSPSAAEAA